MTSPSDQVFPRPDRSAPVQPGAGGEDMIGARPVPPTAVFTRDEARHYGWSDSSLTRAVRAGRLVQVRRGYLSVPGRSGVVIRAAVEACGRSVASHHSALELHGLPIVGRRPALPQVTVPPDATGSLGRAHLYRAALPARAVTVVAGVPVTSVARTLVDVARHAPLSTAVPAIDAALNRALVGYEELGAVVLACWNWPRIRRVHRAIERSDGRAESPLESVSRLVIGWLRLPEPSPQALVLDGSGIVRARLDFYWDEFGVAGEADGRSKYDSRDVLTREKERQEAVEELGVTFTRWGWTDTTRPQLLRTRIERAFGHGAGRDRSGLPREWSIQHAPPVG